MASADLMDFDKALELFEPVVGFEVHVELSTQTKMFSSAPNPAAMEAAGVDPNTCLTPLCIGLPGSLPVVNGTAVEYSISLGLALGCDIAPVSRFSRKNYFYPDLGKNYQISQYDEPIAFEGSVAVELDDGSLVDVPIERAHMEEDAGKAYPRRWRYRPDSRGRIFPGGLQPRRSTPSGNRDQTHRRVRAPRG